ncbi:MAG: Asp-tRNA(Asn)/Glu-tRNA(Gln) amidotransferase subunit GatC [Ginsengibacter sp.]
MDVNDALIEKLAHLSRLEFDEAEKKEIKNDLEKMIGFIDKMNELDTTGVAPLLHMSENVNILRKDEVNGEIDKKDVFKNAPLHDGEFFKVPKVIKKNS